MAMGIKTLQLMKTRLKTLLIVLCSTLLTTAVFGQTTYTWTGASAVPNVIDNSTNWTPAGGPPSPSIGDTAQWDVTSSNLVLVYNGSTPSSSGNPGITFNLTANEANSVSVTYQVLNGSSGNYGLNTVTVTGPGGAFNLGDPIGVANNAVFNDVPRPNGATHDFVNNSTNPCIIYPNVRWQAGGGAVYTVVFDGSGNWLVTNSLVTANGTGIILAKLGTGTWIWNGPSIAAAAGTATINNPLTIGGGTMILDWATPAINNTTIANTATLFEFNAAAQAQTLNGAISGTGPLQVNNGTLTLGGQNTYTGTNFLTGGEVIVNTTENAGSSGPLGEGGANSISFGGGTLGFTVNNTFDYSPSFSTAAGQAYSIDSGGQSVTFATGLTSLGGTLAKVGPGTLTLEGTNTYGGATTVSAGKLVFAGPMTGSGNISLADATALGVTATNAQLTPGTLTVGTSAGATLEFNNVNSTTTALIAAGTLSSAGTMTININSGTFTVGQSYPLLTWTTGPAPTISLGTLNGYIGTLSINGNSIKLSISATAYKWSGANNASWDTTTANNWVQNGGPVIYGANGAGPALFDDTAAGNFSVTVNAAVSSTLLTINNSANPYSIASSGANNIGGSTPLTKSGSSTLTLSGGANTYTGVTTVGAGLLSVGTLANGGSASDIGAAANTAGNLVLNGGTLQYTGSGASIDHLFTLGTGGGTIDGSGAGGLNLNNAGSVGYSGTGVRVLTLTGTTAVTNTLAAVLANNGGATSLAKSGTGTWILTGNNTYSGGTTIANGVLQIGAGGASGAIGTGNINNGVGLDFNRTGSLTVSGAISGNGSVTNDGSGTVILAGNNTYAGSTTINAGTLQIGNGGATGSLNTASPILDDSLLVFNSTSPITIRGGTAIISGTGNITVSGTGVVMAAGPNTYTGWTLINAGATFQPCIGNEGQLVSSVVTNNGTLKLVRQDGAPPVFGYTNNIVGSGRVWKEGNNQNAGEVALLGNNTYTNGTLIGSGGIVLGDNATPGAGSIVGTVTFTNSTVDDTAGRSLQFNRPDNFTFTNRIIGATVLHVTVPAQGDLGSVRQLGTNVTTLTGNNTYQGPTIVSNGVLQVGNGGTAGNIGTNTLSVESMLVFNRSDSITFGGGINGTGAVVQASSGTLTLTGNMLLVDTNGPVIFGALTVSNGTMVLNPNGGSVAANVNVSGGTLVPGGAGTVSTLTLSNNMTITSGTVSVALNKSLSPSNSAFSVVGAINASGGTLKLVNYGPALVAGDKFTIFSQPVTGGATMTISSPGFTVANNLAVDGSVTVTAVAPLPTLTHTLSGTQLTLSWPSVWTGGVLLQSQTNSATVGLSSNWVTIPGTDTGNSYLTTIDKTKGSVFYRLIQE
jgi:autotransporter-associated beta strand protein